MIAGLSFTKEGRDLVQNLEAMRYYHKDGKAFYLGDGARLIISYNESPEYMQDNKIVGALYLPGNNNGKPGHEHLFIDEGCYFGDKIEAALYWSYTLMKYPLNASKHSGLTTSINSKSILSVLLSAGY